MSSRMAMQLLNSESGYYNPARLAETTGLSEKTLQKAMQMAENKTLQWVVSQFTRNLKGELADGERVTITQQALRTRIRVAKANKQGQAARMWAGLFNMNLRRFGVGRSQGTGHVVGRRFVEGGFLARMRSGHEGIFRRVTSRRLPILEEGVPIKIHAWKSVSDIMNEAEDKLAQELKRAIKYLMLKQAGAA